MFQLCETRCEAVSEHLMQKYYLAQDVHLCTIDDGAVLLDLLSNKYFALDPEDMPTLEQCVDGLPDLLQRTSIGPYTDHSRSQSMIDNLVDRGLLTSSRAYGRSAVSLDLISTQAFSAGQRREVRLEIRGTHVINFIAAFTYIAINLRRARLKKIIDRFRNVKTCPGYLQSRGSSKEVLELLLIFRRLRTFAYTAVNECLFDSLVLAEFLHRFCKAPTLIIGVKTKPFLAHAWVQVEECVLDDTVEHVQTLTPILIV
jgi:hypothetical protein